MEEHLGAAAWRSEYSKGALDEKDLAAEPHAQLAKWIEDAVRAEAPEPLAMSLSTVSPEGAPSSRIVLVRGVSKEGLVFYTNYESRKGSEISTRAAAAVLFFWPSLERQVRVEGTVSRISEAESAAYFQSRPRESQIGAWASVQSSKLESREELEKRFADFTEKFQTGDVPIPTFWGGYRLMPRRYEFWQGRPSRLHDRLVYQSVEGSWPVHRLMP